MSLLLPFISSGLDAGACADYRAATLMVVAELSGRVRLGKDFVKGEWEMNDGLVNHGSFMSKEPLTMVPLCVRTISCLCGH